MVLNNIIANTRWSADASKRERIERAGKDFEYFCATYLPHIFNKPFCDYHRGVIDAVAGKNQKYTRYVLAAPREHGKTQVLYVALNLWMALYGYEKYIVSIAASHKMAVGQFRNVRRELEYNEAIIEDFGDVRTKTWKKDEIVLANGVTMAAEGAGCSLRGLVKDGDRPSLINLDDLEKDIVARSKTMRDTLDEWIRRVVIPLGKDARIVYTGTILGYDSVLQRFVKEFEKNPNWYVKVYKALKEGTIEDLRNGRGVPLWPEYWSIEKLQERLEEIGTAAFSTEYMNEPLAKEDMIFVPDTFQYYEALPQPQNMDVVMAIDPSTGKAHGDFQGLVVVGKDRSTGLMYVLDAEGYKLSDVQLTDRIIQKYLRWFPRKIYFEKVGFQSIYKDLVARTASAKGVNLPIEGVDTGGIPKPVRIQTLQAPIENGVLLLNNKHELLLSQLETFHPQANNPDDLPDALAYAVAKLTHSYTGGVAIGRKRPGGILEKLSRWGKK